LETSINKEPLKIGGWLIIIAIGIVITPFKLIYLMITTYPIIFKDGSWEAITTKGNVAFSPFWEPLIITEIVINSILILLSIYLFYLFFAKQSCLPKWYFGTKLFSVLFILVDAFIVTMILPEMKIFDSETIKELASSLFGLFVWSPYLLYSQRSKLTFVNNKIPIT